MARSTSESSADADTDDGASGNPTGETANGDEKSATSPGERDVALDVPPSATDEEVAAIAAAIGAHLAEDEQTVAAATAAVASADDRGWDGRRWGFAGRLAGLGHEPRRVPEGAPTEPWSAIGRVERMR